MRECAPPRRRARSQPASVAAGRRSGGDERQHVSDRHAHDLRFARFLTSGSRRTPRRPSRGCSTPARIPIGKANCDEFAMGSSCENSALGDTSNPYDLDARSGRFERRQRGAAVAAYEAAIGLGSDTGGSIREPAASVTCRLQADLRPSSRYGLDRIRLEPRPDRSVHAHGGRRRARVRRDGRARSDGLRPAPTCRSRRTAGLCARICADCAWVSCGVRARSRWAPDVGRARTAAAYARSANASAPSWSRSRCRPPNTAWRPTT